MDVCLRISIVSVIILDVLVLVALGLSLIALKVVPAMPANVEHGDLQVALAATNTASAAPASFNNATASSMTSHSSHSAYS